jgi:hypothetical protein
MVMMAILPLVQEEDRETLDMERFQFDIIFALPAFQHPNQCPSVSRPARV